ncbi:MAG: A/G-specific adenine glycosylase [Frankiales bacterium]|nr:A/G-specific adenine glycosylase [Frankiales bacterium]
MRTDDPTAPAGVATTLVSWYAEAARDLPWRRDPRAVDGERSPGVGGWAVLVSEVMLQQTPVARVLPAYVAWLDRWPTPAALAREPAGEAVRMWGRLGYHRRALSLHAAAAAIVARHEGEVPADLDDLLALPGVGAYTARAVASFAFGQRHPVVDTNVRRVVARLFEGQPDAAGAAATARERALVESMLPDAPSHAATFSVALMELGALVCTARSPRCALCPVSSSCAWLAAGSPAGSARRAQTYAGTDRQVRGRLLAVLRDHDGPVAADELARAWDEPQQRDRALASLLADGLARTHEDGRYALPD